MDFCQKNHYNRLTGIKRLSLEETGGELEQYASDEDCLTEEKEEFS